ncbi:cation diffusion facilitator family transporter [Streptomyces sp. NPDC052042]|uniref:cation diffusion facilitator family transporter n=1 Tax=Streptomyces sp. NPDC052042 TaxID=3365683 RepID=UPI0037D1FD82
MAGNRHTHADDHHGYGNGHAPGRGQVRGHEYGRGHEQDRGHGRGRDHGHRHTHGADGPPPDRGVSRAAHLRHRFVRLVAPHGHEAADKVDAAMEASRAGMRTLWISLTVLGATTVAQGAVVALSGSVALLGDTVHNAADALTAVPLGIAFLLGRRAANHRYTYGYGRAEDLAGVLVVATIAASAVLAAWTAVDRLVHPRDVTHLWAVSGAALIGFLGNEWVARYRIRTGRRIGSAALVADGLHARSDGFTSLAVLLGAGGAALGLRAADPVIGLLIALAILMVLKDAAREVYGRLMDSVDPALVTGAHTALRAVEGVLGTGQVRMRWIGHELRAEAEIVVDPRLTVVEAHRIAVAAEHALIHAVPRLTATTVHTDHTPVEGDPHAALGHHTTRTAPGADRGPFIGTGAVRHP